MSMIETFSSRTESDSEESDDKDVPLLECSNCKTSQTSQWRTGENGKKLCNSCGLFFSRHGRHKGSDPPKKAVKKEEMFPSFKMRQKQLSLQLHFPQPAAAPKPQLPKPSGKLSNTRLKTLELGLAHATQKQEEEAKFSSRQPNKRKRSFSNFNILEYNLLKVQQLRLQMLMKTAVHEPAKIEEEINGQIADINTRIQHLELGDMDELEQQDDVESFPSSHLSMPSSSNFGTRNDTWSETTTEAGDDERRVKRKRGLETIDDLEQWSKEHPVSNVLGKQLQIQLLHQQKRQQDEIKFFEKRVGCLGRDKFAPYLGDGGYVLHHDSVVGDPQHPVAAVSSEGYASAEDEVDTEDLDADLPFNFDDSLFDYDCMLL